MMATYKVNEALLTLEEIDDALDWLEIALTDLAPSILHEDLAKLYNRLKGRRARVKEALDAATIYVTEVY